MSLKIASRLANCRWVLGVSGLLGFLPAGRSALPAVHPDWRIELVAEAPAIRHPSVVCAAPDDRVFLAEDPMDISTDRADVREGRILCWHPDGRLTLFATNLHAVFGMKYLEGKLYVLHNPQFSVFTDDQGVGRDRVDLIESTNPEPWAKDWNDHVPANFSLGMDGYFYVAVGDKGIYGAVGRDGKRVDLFGGGILRLRPEGTELEAFANGERNILDVAMTDEDDLFTYDNTDEKQWMSRLSHIVEGGFYGYPYDFHPRQPYILWCMADYGAGAATGAFADTENRLPGRYRGSLFLADFGKRQLFNVRIERQGATFRAFDPLDLFPDPPADFRPVGICPSADGRSIYVCDWQHRDSKEKVTVGRLFRLTHISSENGVPFPNWYRTEASGRASQTSVSEFLDALDHPSRNVRLAAQRALSRRGALAMQPLLSLLQDPARSFRARMHALWAADAIDAGRLAQSAILSATSGSDPGLRRQSLRQLGTRRVIGAVPRMLECLRDSDDSVRFQAAVGLGRIGDIRAVASLREVLMEEDEFLRFAAFTALNRIGRSEKGAWPQIVSGLSDARSRVREATSYAMRRAYSLPLVEALATLTSDTKQEPHTRAAAISALASLHRKAPDWKGEWWAYHPVNLPPAEPTIDWSGTPTVALSLRAALSESSVAVRRAAIQALGEARITQAAPDLRAQFEKEEEIEMRCLILEVLGRLKDGEAIPLLTHILNDLHSSSVLIASAFSTSAQIGSSQEKVRRSLATAIARVMQSHENETALLQIGIKTLATLQDPVALTVLNTLLNHKDATIASAAVTAMPKVGDSGDHLRSLLKDPRIEVRKAAINAVASLKDRGSIESLVDLGQAQELHDEVIRALVAMPDLRALDILLKELGSSNFANRELAHRGLKQLRKEALPQIEAKIGDLDAKTLASLQELYSDSPKAQSGPLFAQQVKRVQPEDYLDYVLNHTGKPEEGKKTFNDLAGVACVKCHRIDQNGGDVGPDLSQIGAQYDRRALAESILWPSKVVREGYQQTVIELRDGDTVAGLLKAESAESITLRDAEGNNRVVPKSEISNRNPSALSLMPEGLHSALSVSQFADLIAFLETLRASAGSVAK